MSPPSASSSGVAGGGSGFVRSTIVSVSTAVARTVGRPRYFAATSGGSFAAPPPRCESSGALLPKTVTRRFGSIACGRAGATTTVSVSVALSRLITNATGDSMAPAVAVTATVSASGPFEAVRVGGSDRRAASNPSICTSRK